MNKVSRLTDASFSVLLFLISFFSTGCQKEDGTVYLRVIDSLDIPATVSVQDKNHAITVDGTYYPVDDFLQVNYTLLQVTTDSITQCSEAYSSLLSQTTIKDYKIGEYFGEFVRDHPKIYYTLILKCREEIQGPAEYTYLPGIYYISFYYFDNSTLTYSFTP